MTTATTTSAAEVRTVLANLRAERAREENQYPGDAERLGRIRLEIELAERQIERLDADDREHQIAEAAQHVQRIRANVWTRIDALAADRADALDAFHTAARDLIAKSQDVSVAVRDESHKIRTVASASADGIKIDLLGCKVDGRTLTDNGAAVAAEVTARVLPFLAQLDPTAAATLSSAAGRVPRMPRPQKENR